MMSKPEDCDEFKEDGNNFTHTYGLQQRKRFVWTCDLCAASFSGQYNLKCHLDKRIALRLFTCSICSSAFKSAGSLKQQI